MYQPVFSSYVLWLDSGREISAGRYIIAQTNVELRFGVAVFNAV
jgi:hypothetical protein